MPKRAPRQPRAARPKFAPGYGVPKTTKELKTWAWFGEQFEKSRNYWIGSTKPDGAPHAAPVWGLWIDGAFYFSTDRASRKGKNLARDPLVVVHLESGDEVCILEGTVAEVKSQPVLKKFVMAYAKKYAMKEEDLVEVVKTGVVYTVIPSAAFAWLEKDFVTSVTRWSF